MLPVLYSFRRCPYAIRARLALTYSHTEVEHREALLSDKPAEMLAASPKGTVPVLVLPDNKVIEESLDIMQWALSLNDPDGWIASDSNTRTLSDDLIQENDIGFKPLLDRYKYSSHYPEQTAEWHRDQATGFISRLESLLSKNRYLLTEKITLADMAVFPFIRQFANVDSAWFGRCEYAEVRRWLNLQLRSELFETIMIKIPQWKSVNVGE